MPFDAPFAKLACGPCPSYGEMLVAVEREFRAVHSDAITGRLDELSRPLFGIAAAPADERVITIAAAAWEALPEEGSSPPGWLLARALNDRSASGVVRAALAVELGCRAGVAVRPMLRDGVWMVQVFDGSSGVAAEVGAHPGAPASTDTGCLCAHQVAFAALTGLAGAWWSAGHPVWAGRASSLRLSLPLTEGLREQVEREGEALRGTE